MSALSPKLPGAPVRAKDGNAQKADFAKFRVPNLTGPDGRRLFVEVRQYRLLAYLK